MLYLEQMYIKLLNLVDNHYWQYYDEPILLPSYKDVVHFHHF